MSASYQKFSGLLGIVTGLAGLLYLGFFVALKNPAALPAALSLLVVGICGSAVIVALYQLVRKVDEGFALWGLLLGIAGAGGAAIHSAFDVASNLHPPATPFDYASPIDPRGFLTFAVAGLGAIVVSWLILRGSVLPRAVGYLGIVAGLLLIALYVAYLVLLNATDPLVLGLVLISGIVQPVWYLSVGWSLLQGETARVGRRVATAR